MDHLETVCNVNGRAAGSCGLHLRSFCSKSPSPHFMHIETRRFSCVLQRDREASLRLAVSLTSFVNDSYEGPEHVGMSPQEMVSRASA
jgi:hypothetical protein